MFAFGQVINSVASRPINLNIIFRALAQTKTTAGQHFPAANSSGLRALFIRHLPCP
jgi:hypothetical protein